MSLITDWRKKLNTLWSIRIAIFTSLLASADSILAAFIGSVPPYVYALLAVAIVVARLTYQEPKRGPRPAAQAKV